MRGLHEMVGSCNNFEVDAGMRILAEGGNAVDAGVATTLAAGVTELDHFGLGGEIPILIKLAGKPVVVISGIGTAPKRATVAFYESRKRELWEQPGHMPPMPAEGILASPVPGVMDGLILALERYGTMSFAQVSAPAIEYADGFPVTEVMADWIRGSQPLLQLWPTSRDFFLPNGVAPRRGDVFREPALAKTLRALASAEAHAKGGREERLRAVRDYFYKGPIAREYDEFCKRNGGLISYDDMAGFHAEADTPRTGTYRGYEVFKPGFWSQGPVMIELLNLLEGYDLRAMGHNSPAYISHAGGSHQAGLCRSRPLLRRPEVFQNSRGDAAFERLCSRAAQADRSRARLARDPGPEHSAASCRCRRPRIPRSRRATPLASTWWIASATCSPRRPAAAGCPR